MLDEITSLSTSYRDLCSMKYIDAEKKPANEMRRNNHKFYHTRFGHMEKSYQKKRKKRNEQ